MGLSGARPRTEGWRTAPEDAKPRRAWLDRGLAWSRVTVTHGLEVHVEPGRADLTPEKTDEEEAPALPDRLKSCNFTPALTLASAAVKVFNRHFGGYPNDGWTLTRIQRARRALRWVGGWEPHKTEQRTIAKSTVESCKDCWQGGRQDRHC
jgi:hypothetical protein